MSVLVAVNLPCVTGLPSAFKSESGIAPVSHIRVPFGCTIKYEHTTISVVVSSSFLKWKVAGSSPLITPLSNTYSRTDFGDFGRVWERTKGVDARNMSTAWSVVAMSIREYIPGSIQRSTTGAHYA